MEVVSQGVVILSGIAFTAPAGGIVTITTDIPIDTSLTANEDTEIAIYELPGGDCSDLTDLVEIDCDQDGGQVIDFNSIMAFCLL